MKVEFGYLGIELIPENYQDKLALVVFFDEITENKVADNFDLEFHKDLPEGKSIGGSCSSKDVDFIYWKIPEKERDSDYEWSPIETNEITGLSIGRDSF